ncbi:MAG: glycoside hydrolase family 43 protein [Bacteroidota bacterium]
MKKLLLILLIVGQQLSAQLPTFTNPILPGGFPDPSICRVGDTFYMVNSTFEYFPGLPIHKSTDLVNWELIGYGLHRADQCTGAVNLVDVQSDGGIHAPTIRYHDGLFYIITTNVYYHEATQTTDFVNFIVTAEDPAGQWSEPHVLEGAPGIDPDIFFDVDGKVWYVGTHSPENPTFPGEGEIWLEEIDLEKWELKGERHFLWRGACGGVWVEGPHMYRKDGRYYLMVAEGGTSYNHAVMIAVSDEITGPYVSNERNPILTTRNLSYDNWVVSTGHADLIELADGRWYMVALGIRGDENRGSNMGRETHLLPVIWEREPFEWKDVKYEWPVCAPSTGKVERHPPLPFPNKPQYRKTTFHDDFDNTKPKLEWNFRRVPLDRTFSLKSDRGKLQLFCNATRIKERGRCSLMGFRQTESDFEYSAKMFFNPTELSSQAGISLFQKDNNYFTFTIEKLADGKTLLKVVIAEPGKEPYSIAQQTIDYNGEITFKVISKNQKYHFMYNTLKGDEDFTTLITTRSDVILSKKYTGAYLGVYASGNGVTTADVASFDWVHYQAYERH